jgi:hypothetical protein
LELHAVHGHDAPQELVRSSSTCVGSNHEPHQAWLSHVANQEIACTLLSTDRPLSVLGSGIPRRTTWLCA